MTAVDGIGLDDRGVDTEGLATGVHEGDVLFTGIGASNRPHRVRVRVLVEPPAVVDEQVTTTTIADEQDVAARAQPRELGPSADTLTPDEPGTGLSLRDFGLIAVALVVFLFVGMIVARLVRRWQRRQGPNGDIRTLGAWAELVDRLREAGVRTTPATTVDDVIELTANLDASTRPTVESLGRRAATVFHSPWPTSHEDADEAWRSCSTRGRASSSRIRCSARSFNSRLRGRPACSAA